MTWLRPGSELGQDLVEYAVLVGGIGLVFALIVFAMFPDSFMPFAETLGSCISFDMAACTA
jgi:hypothetical protein